MLTFKPMGVIAGVALFIMLISWAWSKRVDNSPLILHPTWTRSYQLYHQPHAIWLDQAAFPGANLEILSKTLAAAKQHHRVPELVVYTIPLRDLGQSSEGGFKTYDDYLHDNRLNAGLIKRFVRQAKLAPVIYLEPDSIPLAVQYRRDENHSAKSIAIYNDRVEVTRMLIDIYQKAGAKIYLEAGHSGWFDYGEADIQRIANALNEAGIKHANGLATNVSNRQPIGNITEDRTEAHYLSRLLPLLENPALDVRMDTSRNGGPTKARQYFLAPNGQLVDNETPTGRLVGTWEKQLNETETGTQASVCLKPFFGKPKHLSDLLSKEKYTWDEKSLTLSAPPWLDAVGDVQPGPSPTDEPPTGISKLIQHYRYIKPPDDCDGALNCPPGKSKSEINAETAKRQPKEPVLLPPHW